MIFHKKFLEDYSEIEFRALKKGRISQAILTHRDGSKLNIIGCYLSTGAYWKDAHGEIQELKKNIPQDEFCVVLGDFNFVEEEHDRLKYGPQQLT